MGRQQFLDMMVQLAYDEGRGEQTLFRQFLVAVVMEACRNQDLADYDPDDPVRIDTSRVAVMGKFCPAGCVVTPEIYDESVLRTARLVSRGR